MPSLPRITPPVGRSGPVLPSRLAEPLSTVSFWAAIALPACYLSLLASGIETTDGLALFLGLLGLHVLALLGGRAHAA